MAGENTELNDYAGKLWIVGGPALAARQGLEAAAARADTTTTFATHPQPAEKLRTSISQFTV